MADKSEIWNKNERSLSFSWWENATGGYPKTGDFRIWPIIDNEKLFGCAQRFHGQSA